MENVVIGFRDKINAIYEKLNAIVSANDLYSEDALSALQGLKDLNITLIVEDLKKGNYLGNRKIDIDLSLNNTSTTSVPTYQKVNIILIDGTILEMPFDNGSDGTLELSSHGDIKNFIVNHPLYAQIEDTEIVLLESFANNPAMIRIRDADGKSSNVERVELFVFSGAVVESKVNYFWAETTSALQTLANRIGDIIKLGNNFDPMVLLSNKADELVIMQTKLAELMLIHSNLNEILASKNDALAASQSASFAFQKSIIAEDAAILASQKALSASDSATMAADKLSKIQSITVQGQTLTAGQSVSVSYNPITNKFTFGIPQGEKGEKGEAFKVNSIGTIAQRALYDNELTNFSYLASDVLVDGSPIPHIYFKKSNTAGDWTTGIPFGRGEKGSPGDPGVGITSISRTSGDGSAGQIDIYTITLTDGNTHEFSVYNGKDSDINSSDLTALSNAIQFALNQKVNISDIQNTLLSIDTNKPLSAYQGKLLKDYIDNINTLLTSNDTSLDELQEIVNFIKQNKSILDALSISNIAGLADALNDIYTKIQIDNLFAQKAALGGNAIQKFKVATATENDEAVNLAQMNNVLLSVVPAGTVISFAASTAPTGYLKANGALISRTTYASLFAVIGTTFGAGDGITTFAIPDLRGYFQRAWDDGRGIDTGRVFGSNQADAYLNHTHTAFTDSQGAHTHTTALYSTDGSQTNISGSGNSNTSKGASTTSTSGAHTHTVTVNTSITGSNETRPKNLALLYCIKY